MNQLRYEYNAKSSTSARECDGEAMSLFIDEVGKHSSIISSPLILQGFHCLTQIGYLGVLWCYDLALVHSLHTHGFLRK